MPPKGRALAKGAKAWNRPRRSRRAARGDDEDKPLPARERAKPMAEAIVEVIKAPRCGRWAKWPYGGWRRICEKTLTLVRDANNDAEGTGQGSVRGPAQDANARSNGVAAVSKITASCVCYAAHVMYNNLHVYSCLCRYNATYHR